MCVGGGVSYFTPLSGKSVNHAEGGGALKGRLNVGFSHTEGVGQHINDRSLK